MVSLCAVRYEACSVRRSYCGCDNDSVIVATETITVVVVVNNVVSIGYCCDTSFCVYYCGGVF